MSVFDSAEYEGWRQTRLAALKNYYGSWLPGKRVLVLADGVGHVARALEKEGCVVVSSDAREEHVLEARKRGSVSVVYNTEDPWPSDVPELQGRFNLVVHWGLLYHVQDLKASLQCLTRTDFCCLESEVWNSTNPKDFRDHPEQGPDQAASAHSKGKWVTAEAVDSLLFEYGCAYHRDHSPAPNYSSRQYDWRVGAEVANPRRWWWVNCPKGVIG